MLGSRPVIGGASGRVTVTLSTSDVLSAVEPTPMPPIESMSLRWYSSLMPPPTMWRKSALIARLEQRRDLEALRDEQAAVADGDVLLETVVAAVGGGLVASAERGRTKDATRRGNYA